MRIGLNLLYMIPGVVGGTETYARGLLGGLKQLRPNHEFVLFLNRESSALDFADAPGFRTIICPVNALGRMHRYYFEQVQLRRYLKEHKVDLLHSLGYTSPLLLRCPTVVTVHDLNFKAFGDSFPIARRLMLGLSVKQSIFRSNKVITVSEFSRQEILREYRIPQEKVVVTHEAVDLGELGQEPPQQVDESMQSLGIEQPYVVAFSSTYHNKNILRLMEAFGNAKKKNRLNQKLVLIGHRYSRGDEREDAQLLIGNRHVIWAGYLQRRDVYKVLKGADFLVFPSYYEGFGLPVLEAMAAGVPVVCSKAASLPEIAGDAAMFFDPFSVKEIEESIVLAANNVQLREDLRQKGYENLKRFSWTKTAAQTVAVYDEILRGDRKKS
jgi:glycosyltransferase involved in cell wall biosynthesis